MAWLYYIESATVCGNDPIKKNLDMDERLQLQNPINLPSMMIFHVPRWDTLGTPGGETSRKIKGWNPKKSPQLKRKTHLNHPPPWLACVPAVNLFRS